MHPLFFADAVRITGPDLNHNSRIGHLNWVWIHFHQNIHQGLNLLVLPALSHLTALHATSAFTGVSQHMAVESAFKKTAINIEDVLKQTRDHFVGRMSWPSEQQREALKPMAEKIAQELESNGTSIYSIILSLYRSVLTQTYAAFESLAEELWEKALNVHPHDLSQVTFPERDRKGIMPEKLQAMGFDLSKKMGTLLKTKFRFEVLREIRLAYTEAFSTNGGEVMRAVKDSRLDVICLIRNAIVHSGCVIDASFMEQSKTIVELASVRSLGEGAGIPLDGKMLKEVVEGCIQAGTALFNAVDGWLIDNPAP